MTKERISSYTIKLKRYGTEKKIEVWNRNCLRFSKKKKKKEQRTKNNIVYFVDS